MSSFVETYITVGHEMEEAYRIFDNKVDGVIKVAII